MIEITDHIKKELLKLQQDRNIVLEGNILKVMDAGGDEEFQQYLVDAIIKDKDTRRKRLEITKKIQSQNTELYSSEKENIRVNRQLTKALEEADQSNMDMIKAKDAAVNAKNEAEDAHAEALNQKSQAEESRKEAENAKTVAVNDLEMLQKKTQFELIGTIVKVALSIILGVGIVTTVLYSIVLYNDMDSTIIGSTWTNIISILLTNSFSIIGTIMGVKYATGNKKEN